MTKAPAPISLRERKKTKLRETIQDCALRLFLAHGYEETTLEQVCEEAETSLRTLLRYFPTKEELALGREAAAQDALSEEFEKLDGSTPAILVWRDVVIRNSRPADLKHSLDLLRLFEAVPSISSKLLALQVRYEDMLAKTFAREAGLSPDEDIHGRLLAGMLIAGNRAAARKWLASEGKLDLRKLRTEVVDWAVKHFPSRAETSRKLRTGQ